MVAFSLSECYFANKGAALVLPAAGRRATRRPAPPAAAAAPPDIQHHLQSMFYLLRPEETLNMAVKLESAHPGRTRYLAVVCRGEEAALLGVDCARRRTTVGLVLRVLADTSIKLDGDGGFSVCVCGRQHIFKPVSVQAMWSALQSLHRASARARDHNHFAGGAGASHAWTDHYEQHVASDRSCLNEWHAMDCIESRRPPSPDSLRTKPREREETEKVIRSTLKEIMMSVDLDEVTSKFIRSRLEADLNMDLGEFKSFIDQEMLTILGQMDAPTEIFDHVYLGSEWNASNLEELQRNGVRHILNVTREIDNFFPGMFDYLNIRVYDDEKTDLLKHWDNTFKYITKAKKEGSKVLVHCKMGVSRSASMVIAYAMKAYDWNFERALKHVKEKRNCIKPNTSFLTQLETYQGILDAMKNREKLQRSKSETNLKSSEMASKIEAKVGSVVPLLQVLAGAYGGRPRSWSPDTRLAAALLPARLPPTSLSLETLAPVSVLPTPPSHTKQARHMLMPCANGSYSVSPNQIMNLNLKEEGVPSVKTIIHELESAVAGDKRMVNKRNVRLSFSNFVDSRIASDAIISDNRLEEVGSECIIGRMEQRLSVDKTHTWDPGEVRLPKPYESNDIRVQNEISKCDSGILELNAKNRPNDSFSHSTDRIFDREEKRYGDAAPPSRQSSWSSFDSAVVPDLSRHSSWGSYDTRSLKAPQHPEDLALAAVAAKRTRQKSEEASVKRASAEFADTLHKAQLSDLDIISENRTFEASISRVAKNNDYGDKVTDNERKFNETCAIIKRFEFNSDNLCVGTPSASWPRLSTSAPGDSCLRLALGTRRLRPASSSLRDLSSSRRVDIALTSSGLVRNLKKEFEARSDEATASVSEADRKAVLSSPTEDLSVKVLVDKYDSNSSKNKTKCTNEHVDAKVNNGRSNVEDAVTLKKTISNCDSMTCALRSRPPASGGGLTVSGGLCVGRGVSTATGRRQLQHGKTHPLSRLSLRGSNPVYNTM